MLQSRDINRNTSFIEEAAKRQQAKAFNLALKPAGDKQVKVDTGF
jgi:hypothetical protein